MNVEEKDKKKVGAKKNDHVWRPQFSPATRNASLEKT